MRCAQTSNPAASQPPRRSPLPEGCCRTIPSSAVRRSSVTAVQGRPSLLSCAMTISRSSIRRSVVRRRRRHPSRVDGQDRSEGNDQQHRRLASSTPSTSRVLTGCRPCPSSRNPARPPVRSLGAAVAHPAGLYITRVMVLGAPESTANRSGSSSRRSSLRGHHAPSTYPVGGALGFNRSRGVFSGPTWRWRESRCPLVSCNDPVPAAHGPVTRPVDQ